MSDETALNIVETGIPVGSMRGLKFDIEPIDNGVIVEMLDYSLRDQTDPAGRKFEGTITSDDINAPPVWGTWKGSILTIDFPGDVIEPVAMTQVRTAAAGSLYYADANMQLVQQSDPTAVWRCYRPGQLKIMVMEPWKLSYDEYEATVGMTIKWREC